MDNSGKSKFALLYYANASLSVGNGFSSSGFISSHR
jgi:hypothetical protein